MISFTWMLPDEDLSPKPLHPDPRSWLPTQSDLFLDSKHWLDQSDQLLEERFFGTWMVDSKEDYQWIRDRLTRTGNWKRNRQPGKREQVARFILPRVEFLVARLLREGDLAKGIRKNSERWLKLAGAVVLALEEGKDASRIPFFTGLAARNTEYLRGRIQQGFTGPEQDDEALHLV